MRMNELACFDASYHRTDINQTELLVGGESEPSLLGLSYLGGLVLRRTY
jgi:hypothetical protein